MESSLPLAPDAKGNVVVFIPFHVSMMQEQARTVGKEVDDEWVEEVIPAPANLSGQAAMMRDNFKRGSAENVEKHKDRAFTVVTYPGDEARDVLGALKANDTLYILGHGGVGSSLIDSNLTGGDMKESLNPQDVLKRMSAAGVSPNVGKIKLFSCHSAEGEEQENTFLQAFDAARKQPVAAGAPSYANAELTGYNGSLSTQGLQKTATVRDVLGGSSQMMRASKAAVHIPQRPG